MRCSFLLVVVVALQSARIFAQQDAPTVDAAAILREITALEEKQKQTIQGARQSVMNVLRPGLGSGSAAADLYARAVEATDFKGRQGGVSAFQEWKKKNADLLRSAEFQTAARLHLKYLLLSMERGGSDKPLDFAKPAMDYGAEMAQAEAKNDFKGVAKDLLGKKITDSIFTRWLQLSQWLPSEKDWEMIPDNLAGILEKDARVPLREAGDANLISVWDFEIQTRKDSVASGKLRHAAEDFNTVQLPKLQFARANDQIVLGRKNRGITDILSLVRAYPQHPDFAAWIQRLRNLLEAKSEG